MRRNPLVTGYVYHIFNKSIAKYVIFNNNGEFLRFLNVIRYYQHDKPGVEFSHFVRYLDSNKEFINLGDVFKNKKKLVEIIAYCLMPTHFHLVLKQLIDGGVSIFMNNIQNSYTRYFNIKHRRMGPLWASRFKSVLASSDEHLLQLTRYVHLNPVEAKIVKKPQDWEMSSYKEYLLKNKSKAAICKFCDILQINPNSYKYLVEDEDSYREDLERLSDLFIDSEE